MGVKEKLVWIFCGFGFWLEFSLEFLRVKVTNLKFPGTIFRRVYPQPPLEEKWAKLKTDSQTQTVRQMACFGFENTSEFSKS